MITSQHSPSSDIAPVGNVNTTGIIPFANKTGYLRLYVTTLVILNINIILLNLFIIL